MNNKPEGATHYNKTNKCFYRVSSDKANDWALCVFELRPEAWEMSEHWENQDLDIYSEYFEKV